VATFPRLLLLTTVLGVVLAGHPVLRQQVLQSALHQFPVIGDQLAQPHQLPGGAVAVVAGIAGALYGAMGVGQAVQNAMDSVWAVPRNVRPDPVRSRLRSLVLLLALGSAAIAATVLSGVANTADSFGFISTAAVMTASVAINTVFALVLGMLAFLYLIAASLVLCAEINVVRVDRLHPRALLSPFTDNVELTDGDRKTYTGRAKAERAKGFQRVEVSFDQRESQQRRAADTPRPTTAHG
jgi:membrane protein